MFRSTHNYEYSKSILGQIKSSIRGGDDDGEYFADVN